MVSDCMEDCESPHCIRINKILLERILVGIPVKFPCHITQSHCVDLLTGICSKKVGDFIGKLLELVPVICTVSKVYVPEEKHCVICLVTDFL